MNKTISEEMPDNVRRDELIAGMSATAEDVVFVNLSHLAQAVGLKKAEDLADSLVETTELVNPNLSPRSTLRMVGRRNAMCQVDRVAALDACKSAKGSSSKSIIDNKLKT